MTDLLRVEDLAVSFNVEGGQIDTVRGVSFRVPQGGTVALVGESGSGKTVVSQANMRILPESARIARGQILFADPEAAGAAAVDLAALPQDGAKMRAIRGARMSIIFQEPMTSLSPLHTIGDQVSEALRQHRDLGGAESRKLTAEMLRLVGFPNPGRALKTYPFELSGGLRQRAMIAMALICRPALLIADEPTTALDVTIQAQILKLMKDLQAELRMAVLIITHDLGVVANVAEEVVVMYHGEVMEAGTLADIFGHPTHPYLRALFQAVPRFHMKKGERLVPIREIKSATGHLLAGKEGADKAAAIDGPLVRVEGVSKTYTIRKAGFFGARADEAVLAVDDVSFEIYPGECLGLVGESGCGKTTLSKVLLRALEPDCGAVVFNDKGKRIDVLALSG
ncbi:MAG: ATP-binding cassette domain-containing protein, partial [Dongiaceae bacterium]